jgi:hypothetical protein
VSDLLGPKNEDERRIFIEEGLRVDWQHAITKAMNEYGVTRGEVATRLYVEPRHVDAIFGPRWNPTIKEYARILAAIQKGTPL